MFFVRHFTDHIYLGGNSYETKKTNHWHVAKILYAVSRAVGALQRYYSSLRLRNLPKSSHLLPCPAYLQVSNSFPPESCVRKTGSRSKGGVLTTITIPHLWWQDCSCQVL